MPGIGKSPILLSRSVSLLLFSLPFLGDLFCGAQLLANGREGDQHGRRELREEILGGVVRL
jgi:hypothetical protein